MQKHNTNVENNDIHGCIHTEMYFYDVTCFKQITPPGALSLDPAGGSAPDSHYGPPPWQILDPPLAYRMQYAHFPLSLGNFRTVSAAKQN